MGRQLRAGQYGAHQPVALRRLKKQKSCHVKRIFITWEDINIAKAHKTNLSLGAPLKHGGDYGVAKPTFVRPGTVAM